MNRVYRVIFNCARGLFQAVSEHASGRGQCRTTVRAGACVLMLAAWVPAQAQGVDIDAGRHEVIDGLDPEGDGSGTQPSPWEIEGPNSVLSVGNSSTGALTIRNGGQVNNDFGHIGVETGSSGMVTVRGIDSTWTNSSDLVVGVYGEGKLSIEGGGQVHSATGYLGYTHGGNGTVTVTGLGSAWTNSLSLVVGLQSAGVLTVMDGGKAASPHVQLGTAGHAVLNMVGTPGARGVLETGYIGKGVGAGSAAFTFNGGILRALGDEADFLRNFTAGDVLFEGEGAFIDSNGHDIGIATDLQGAGGLTKLGKGTLTLSGTNSYAGVTTVEDGTLRVNGRLASDITVNDGATLGGSGTVGNTTVEAGGILAAGNSIGTLTVAGELALSAGSILDFELGASGPAADAAAGRSDRINVSGNLQLSGTLNLAQSPNASDGAVALGYYRLMTYDGALSGGGLAVGTVPYGDASLYEISAGDHKVDLFVSASPGDDSLQHWQGGDGAWNASNTQWLNQDSDVPAAWAGNHAVFKHEPGGFDGGVIDVVGAQRFKGLQFVDEGYRLQGAGSLETDPGGSEIRVLADHAEIAGNITGMGGIRKTEAGTLVLSGANSYLGGTTIGGGVLSVSNDANLGHEDGVLAFNGGVLRITGTAFNDTERNIVWGGHGGGFDIADAANNFYLDRGIVGPGDLIKRGDGTLTLAGANAYGDTRIEAGSVVGNTGSISGNIANAGAVTFNQAADGRFAGDITGWGGTDGAMTKDGAGVLTLDGRSTLDWAVAQGGLTTAAGRFSGDVLLDGAATTLTFTDENSAAYGGRLSGNGQLMLAGSGALLLTGDSGAFAGATTVANGALLVDNGQGRGALGGSLKVLDGATLGGSGTVGSGPGSQIAIASGGTLAPGNSIGTLTVDGDLVFASGSSYAVEVDPQGSGSDHIEVTGKATLQGGSVVHIGADGPYQQDARYRILSAATGLEGAFDAVSSNFAFLTPTLAYDYDNFAVDLTLQRNETSFESLANTPNQIATAQGLQSLPHGSALLQRIVTLPQDTPASIFDALSGEVHASVASALHMGVSAALSVPLSHLRANLAAGRMPGASLAQAGRHLPAQALPRPAAMPLWAQVVGNWQSMDGDGNAAALKQSTSGLFVGGDHAVGGGWRLGAALGYTDSRVRVDDRDSKADVDTYSATLYGGKSFEAGSGRLNVLVGGAYSRHDIGTTRRAAVADWNHTLKADYDTDTYQLFGELGYAVPTGRATLEPFIGLAWTKLHTRSFSESGGPTALSGPSQSQDTTTGTLGLRAGTNVELSKTQMRVHGTVGWRHAFGRVAPRLTLAFSGGQPFVVAGAPIARDSAVLGLGADIILSSNARIGLAYNGQLGGGNREHTGKIDVQWRF